jgi:CheY-like chemotaxis protein
MADAGRILWIDNDPAYLSPFKKALELLGYEVAIVTTVSDAENVVKDGSYDLVILDVMIPMTEKDEEAYSPTLTDFGYKTGLVFYNRNRDLLLARSLPVMVLTVRLDQGVVDEFVEAGLPRQCFATKYELRDVESFLGKIRSSIEAGKGQV